MKFSVHSLGLATDVTVASPGLCHNPYLLGFLMIDKVKSHVFKIDFFFNQEFRSKHVPLKTATLQLAPKRPYGVCSSLLAASAHQTVKHVWLSFT